MDWRFTSNQGDGVEVKPTDECGEIEMLLSLHSDGMASDAEVRRAMTHMDACTTCRRAFFWMRATHDVLVAQPDVPPPPDMSSRIRRAIAAADLEESRPARLRFNLKPAYGIAASLVIAAVLAASFHAIQGPSGNRNLATNPSSLTSATTKPSPLNAVQPLIASHSTTALHPLVASSAAAVTQHKNVPVNRAPQQVATNNSAPSTTTHRHSVVVHQPSHSDLVAVAPRPTLQAVTVHNPNVTQVARVPKQEPVSRAGQKSAPSLPSSLSISHPAPAENAIVATNKVTVPPVLGTTQPSSDSNQPAVSNQPVAPSTGTHDTVVARVTPPTTHEVEVAAAEPDINGYLRATAQGLKMQPDVALSHSSKTIRGHSGRMDGTVDIVGNAID